MVNQIIVNAFNAIDSALTSTQSLTELNKVLADLTLWVEVRAEQLKKFDKLL